MKKSILVFAASLVVSLATSAYAGASAVEQTTTSSVSVNPQSVRGPQKGIPKQVRFKHFAKEHPQAARMFIIHHNMK